MAINPLNVIPYGKQSISDDDIAAVVEVLKSDFLTTGPWVESFERELCALTGARYAIACSNGTTALHLACIALGVGSKSLGITSPNTFLASANCIEYCGGSTDFLDIDDTLCISPAILEKDLVNGLKPDVVIPVDFAGVPANLPELFKLSEKYGFQIIEDAAHAIGSTYRSDGQEYQCGCCRHSHAAIFSFHPVKSITCGEGGAVLTNDESIAQKIRLFRSHGMTKNHRILSRNEGPWYYEMVALGNNYRITDFQCALGVSQLKRIHEFKARRLKIVRFYNDAFKNTPGLLLPPNPEGSLPLYHLYVLRFQAGERMRTLVYDELVKNGITPQVHYFPVHLQPYYTKKYGYIEGKCPNAESYYRCCLSLPLFPALTDVQMEFVAEIVCEVMKTHCKTCVSDVNRE